MVKTIIEKEDDSMLIFCDNMRTIVLAKGDGYRKKTNHIDVDTTSSEAKY